MKTLRVALPVIVSACSMAVASFSSCEKQSESPGKETPKEPFVSVDFGDGEHVWSASYSEWTDNRTEYYEVSLYLEHPEQFPAVMGSVIPQGTTTFPDSWAGNEYLFFEYYSHRWPEIERHMRDFGHDITYGDWQVDSGTVTITALSATMLSGKAGLVMFDFYDETVNGNPNPEKKPLTVIFENIPIAVPEDAPDTRAVPEPGSFRVPRSF